MSTFDFGPSTRTITALLVATREDQLGDPTPCPAYSVGDLVEHIGGVARGFTMAARKQTVGDGPEPGDATLLEEGWRERMTADYAELERAWREPGAYDGLTYAGPVELPAPVAASVALNEIVVHGWDLAHATGQSYAAEPTDVAACRAFVAGFEAPADDDGGLFGPPVEAPAGSSDLDVLVGLTGRDPRWSPPARSSRRERQTVNRPGPPRRAARP